MQSINLLTTAAAAKFLSVRQAFLERDRWAGPTIPYIKVGSRAVRYRMADLLAFIDAQSTRALAGASSPRRRALSCASCNVMSGPSAASAHGLVYSPTSDTFIPLDRKAMRLKRMKCGTITAARLLQEQQQKGCFRYKVAMLTLTYANIYGYHPRHISDLVKHVRHFLARRGVPLMFVWVMELQKRGAPHYHILIWLPKGVTLPKPDKKRWWRHGLTRIEWVRNCVGYIAKYASKEEGGKFPKGARIHGCGGLAKAGAQERRWWLYPGWVRKLWGIEDDVIRCEGGGFFSRITGEWVPSPYKVCLVNGVLGIVRRDKLRPWQRGYLAPVLRT